MANHNNKTKEYDLNIYKDLFIDDGVKQNNNATCRCDMTALFNGFDHDDNCPEKGKTLAKWQPKKWRY